MEENILNLTKDLEKNTVLQQDQFDQIVQSIKCKLPADYIEYMQTFNGGEGVVGDNGKYVRFWPLEELLEANEDYMVHEFASELFLIGSDGGDTAYGLKKESGVFIEVPFIGMSDDEAIERGNNFNEFLNFLSIPFE